MTMERRTGWYFTPQGELRECVVIQSPFAQHPFVLDMETGKAVPVAVEDVLTDAPKPD
ncbi:MAG TPA: hypothetical protein VF202_03085 [Trueperaceae bacterium]